MLLDVLARPARSEPADRVKVLASVSPSTEPQRLRMLPRPYSKHGRTFIARHPSPSSPGAAHALSTTSSRSTLQSGLSVRRACRAARCPGTFALRDPSRRSPLPGGTCRSLLLLEREDAASVLGRGECPDAWSFGLATTLLRRARAARSLGSDPGWQRAEGRAALLCTVRAHFSFTSTATSPESERVNSVLLATPLGSWHAEVGIPRPGQRISHKESPPLPVQGGGTLWE